MLYDASLRSPNIPALSLPIDFIEIIRNITSHESLPLSLTPFRYEMDKEAIVHNDKTWLVIDKLDFYSHEIVTHSIRIGASIIVFLDVTQVHLIMLAGR